MKVLLLLLLLFVIVGITVSFLLPTKNKYPVECPEQHDDQADLLPNPYDCGTYYQCANGIPFLMPCPAGLHFNAETDRCDYPENAGCKAQKPPVTTAEPEMPSGTAESPTSGGTAEPPTSSRATQSQTTSGTTESNGVCKCSCSCEKYREICGL